MGRTEGEDCTTTDQDSDAQFGGDRVALYAHALAQANQSLVMASEHGENDDDDMPATTCGGGDVRLLDGKERDKEQRQQQQQQQLLRPLPPGEEAPPSLRALSPSCASPEWALTQSPHLMRPGSAGSQRGFAIRRRKRPGIYLGKVGLLSEGNHGRHNHESVPTPATEAAAEAAAGDPQESMQPQPQFVPSSVVTSRLHEGTHASRGTRQGPGGPIGPVGGPIGPVGGHSSSHSPARAHSRSGRPKSAEHAKQRRQHDETSPHLAPPSRAPAMALSAVTIGAASSRCTSSSSMGAVACHPTSNNLLPFQLLDTRAGRASGGAGGFSPSKAQQRASHARLVRVYASGQQRQRLAVHHREEAPATAKHANAVGASSSPLRAIGAFTTAPRYEEAMEHQMLLELQTPCHREQLLHAAASATGTIGALSTVPPPLSPASSFLSGPHMSRAEKINLMDSSTRFNPTASARFNLTASVPRISAALSRQPAASTASVFKLEATSHRTIQRSRSMSAAAAAGLLVGLGGGAVSTSALHAASSSQSPSRPGSPEPYASACGTSDTSRYTSSPCGRPRAASSSFSQVPKSVGRIRVGSKPRGAGGTAGATSRHKVRTPPRATDPAFSPTYEWEQRAKRH